MDIPLFPTINASLNLTAALLLIGGYRAIRRGERQRHKHFMIAALCASVLFLICYIAYHYTSGVVTKYEGEGILRVIYFAILLTHTPLATLIVPFIIAAVVFALKGQYDRHVKLTRWLWPTWMYVSITGVLIYLMLYIL
jgi:uncharacterized membrane protein YozB (DUF420 family)